MKHRKEKKSADTFASTQYQNGENNFGGVVVIISKDLKTKRYDCNVPNLCAVNIELDEKIRVVGIYTPASKKWSWTDLTQVISTKCVLLGNFNVDIDKDLEASEALLQWADDCNLIPYISDSFTSLRTDSHRTIDYALASALPVSIQMYEGSTTSDHKPILSALSCARKELATGKNVHWRIFSLFLSFVLSFWQEQWNFSCIDDVYKDHVLFLSLLIARLIVHFPLNK